MNHWGHNPQLIKIWISKIPCADRSSEWLDVDRDFWPKGWGPKLLQLENEWRDILWEIAYQDGYPDQGLHAACLANVALLDHLPKARAGQISYFD